MLTDTQIKNLKPTNKVYRKTDQQGLCIEVRPNGKKYWYYRFSFDKKATMMLLGEYPLLSLSDARAKHLQMRNLLKQGINPITKQRQDRKTQQAERQDLFKYHADNFISRLEQKRSAGYIQQIKGHLRRHILPQIGDKAIKEIDTVDIIEMMHAALKNVTNNRGKRGTGEVTAEMCRQLVSLIFRHAMRSVRGLHDPTIAAKGEVERPPINHARDLTLDELKQFLGRLQEYGGMPSTIGVIQTMLYTMCRAKEARFMRWEHIDFERRLWNIPLAEISRRKQGERNMKTDRPHIVPLSNQMMQLLEKMHKISGLGEFVFPSNKNPSQPIGKMTVNGAISYMGFDNISGHDLRSTGSTYLHGMGYDTQHINLQMAHVDNTVSGIYNHALYLPERTKMLQAWADYLDSLRF
ncbi:tyrosine-type recombinase/integrase [Moraxella sp. ZJ142]|uniref:tyrosine-type recombinase/integrase n=1 Tax=Moraxella marmotae TaxID=3344520 RepID=UPI0035D46964